MNTFKYAKAIMSVFAIALAAIVLYNCFSIVDFSSDKATTTTTQAVNAQVTAPITQPAPPSSAPAQQVSDITSAVPSQVVETPTESSSVQTPSDTTPASQPAGADTASDPASWSKDEIVRRLGEAVTKTKAFTGTVSVHRTEALDATVNECTGGSVVKNIANSAISSIVKPSDETLTFNNGTATTAEGEQTQLLLPTKSAFTLTADGVQSASAVTTPEGKTQLTVQLIPETGTMTVPPTYNAAGIGYLDIASLDISVVTINEANINYKGSSIVADINSDGMVDNIVYTIPLDLEIMGSKGLINATVKVSALQNETWTIQW